MSAFAAVGGIGADADNERRSVNERSGSIIQMEMPSLLALHAIDGAVGGFLVGLSIQRDPDRKTAGHIVPDDLNAADGLAAGPLSNGLQALLSESSVAQSDRDRFRHTMRPRSGHGRAFSVD